MNRNREKFIIILVENCVVIKFILFWLVVELIYGLQQSLTLRVNRVECVRCCCCFFLVLGFWFLQFFNVSCTDVIWVGDLLWILIFYGRQMIIELLLKYNSNSLSFWRIIVLFIYFGVKFRCCLICIFASKWKMPYGI